MSVADRDVKAVLALHERLDRIRRDDRFGTSFYARQVQGLAEAFAWAEYDTRGHDALDAEARVKAYNAAVERHSGMTWRDALNGPIREDAPRYEPPQESGYRGCNVPMERGPRVGKPCGKSGARGGRVTNPATGEWRLLWWCRKHEAWAHAAYIAEQQYRKSGTVPEPLPNTGGLLPCLAPEVSNWPDLYLAARGVWTPPKVGIRADDWPVMTAVVEKEPPRLAVVEGGRTGTDDAGLPEAPAVALQLVRGGRK